MAECGARAGVGPMAAVAGAIAILPRDLAGFTSDLIIENGGDIYLKSRTDRLLGIFAGKSPLSGKIGIEIAGGDTPLGISTSSGTVGHSLSFGKARRSGNSGRDRHLVGRFRYRHWKCYRYSR